LLLLLLLLLLLRPFRLGVETSGAVPSSPHQATPL
jgi:hypothetical protein